MLFNQYPMNRSGRGFSLVEIMIAVVVGMLGILIIMQVFLVSEGQKRTTTGGADAQENALMAMFTLEREMRIAGLGLVGLGLQPEHGAHKLQLQSMAGDNRPRCSCGRQRPDYHSLQQFGVRQHSNHPYEPGASFIGRGQRRRKRRRLCPEQLVHHVKPAPGMHHASGQPGRTEDRAGLEYPAQSGRRVHL
ncbi:MAG: prepilin-type N-terminal cleavage/methylation domain-containing protein [Betaproteobacteria bacterium]|nr:prepilin-type N-terminal cleavage/methylation domain-containing protein [Betaproteobacteria bacterium]